MFFHLLKRRKPRFLRGILQVACSKATPKSSKVCNGPQIMLVVVDSRRSPEHVFSSPATEGRYQNRGSKKYLLKAQVVQSLEVSAALVRKVYRLGTAATFCQQNRSQGRRPKRETVPNSTSVRQQSYTLETASLQSVEL